MATGTGFGKTILIGDQFVLREVPAIVAALPYETEVCVEVVKGAGEGWTIEDNRLEVPGYKQKKRQQQVASINRILEVMEIDVKQTPLRITFGGTLLAGSGVGASAAGCVALARALNETFGLGMSMEQINHVAWEGEFPYHGIPSGIDNTASTYGGLLQFWISNGETDWQRINVARPIRVVLANSGVTADTTTLDGFVLSIRESDPAAFEQRMAAITEQSLAMKQALEADDLDRVGRLMTNNHNVLVEMGLSHEILVLLCTEAIKMGALGAKLTGGGRGGYMIALTPQQEIQQRVAAAFTSKGYKVIQATIGQ